MDKYTGKRLDSRYEIHELIGVGGMAVVYKAYDTYEDRIVAIKILKDEYLGNREFIKSFKNESKAIAVLSHPNIVKVYDVSFGTKIQYIVMEYIDGITLKEYIARQKEIKYNEAVYFIQQILCALKHAHSKGVIHRDIKPQNIMLLKDGNIKVTDFGIARFCTNETQTMMDRAIGSVHYIAPEQAKGGVTDEKADIYSVGVMLYEMITGELPFEADNAVSVAIMQMQTKPKPPREIKKSIPEGLEEITLHAMEKNPANRYKSADLMLEDIEKFQQNPEIKFNYKCFVDDNPTKYVEPIEGNNKTSDVYDDNFEYTEEEKKKKSRSVVVIGGIAIAVALFAIISVFITVFSSCGNNSAKDVDVPNFIGMKLSDVQNNPNYKFVFKVESVYDSTKFEGEIIDQDPEPNTKKIKEDGTILLKVNSSGVLVTVPPLKGANEEVAKARLNNAGLKNEVLMVVDDETAVGVVRGSDPPEGSKVTADSTVRLYVSKGPATQKVNMPDVIDKSLNTAKNEISAAGLKLDSIAYESSDKAKDIVISSDPLPGVTLDNGSTVRLTVSSGVKKDRVVTVNVDLPTNVKKTVRISSYINGVMSASDDVVPAYAGSYSVSVKGSSGKKTVNVDIDGNTYRVYEVDFDVSSNNVKTIASYEYKGSVSNDTGDQDSDDENTVYSNATTTVFKSGR